MEFVDVLGYLAGSLVVGSLLPQVWKSWRTKMTRDLSFWRYFIYSVGLILWIVYAFLIQNAPVAVMNSLGLLLALSILFLKMRYR